MKINQEKILLPNDVRKLLNVDNKEIVELLVSKGANLNFVSRDGQTALILATGSGNFDICRILAENGADPTIKDRMGMSSIDYATLFKKEDILNRLKEIKRDPTRKVIIKDI